MGGQDSARSGGRVGRWLGPGQSARQSPSAPQAPLHLVLDDRSVLVHHPLAGGGCGPGCSPGLPDGRVAAVGGHRWSRLRIGGGHGGGGVDDLTSPRGPSSSIAATRRRASQRGDPDEPKRCDHDDDLLLTVSPDSREPDGDGKDDRYDNRHVYVQFPAGDPEYAEGPICDDRQEEQNCGCSDQEPTVGDMDRQVCKNGGKGKF